MLSLRKLARSFYEAGVRTLIHDGVEHAGYLAFLGLIAFFPFMVFVVALTGFIGAGEAGAKIIHDFMMQLPQGVGPALEPRIAEILSGPPQGLLTISIVGAIWTASSAVEGYRTVLNRAYNVESPPSYLFRRLLSIAQTLVFSFLVVCSMLLLVIVPIIWGKMQPIFVDWHVLDVAMMLASRLTLISMGLMFLLVSMSYYFIPNIKQSWHSVGVGAAVVTLGWVVAANLLTFYLSQFNQVNLIYGSLGGIIAVLLFFYISNIIFIYGAELNYLIKEALGEKMEEKKVGTKKEN